MVSGYPDFGKTIFVRGAVANYRLEAGTETTDAAGEATITFSEVYTQPPIVIATSYTDGVVVKVTSRTASGFTVRTRKVVGITTESAGSHSHTISTAGAHDHEPFTYFSEAKTVGGHTLTVGELAAHTHSDVASGLEATGSTGGNLAHDHSYSDAYISSLYSLGAAGGAHNHGGSTGTAGEHTHLVFAPVVSADFGWMAVGV